METLNVIQVKQISSEVELAGITLHHLADELVDHICCEVEIIMSRGKSFEEAYSDVKNILGIKNLQKIQEDTLVLTDNNYKTMKTLMKTTGLISLIMLGTATVFKIFHWPGAGVGFVLGFFILSIAFLPSALYVNFRDVHKKKNLLLHITAFLGTVLFITGILFKVMHWPGSSFELLAGSAILTLVYAPTLLVIKLKKAKSKNEKWGWVLGIFALVVFQLAFVFKIVHFPGAFALMIVGSVLLFSIFLPVYTNRKIKESGKITGAYIYLITLSMFAILFTFLITVNASKDPAAHFIKQYENANHILDYLEKTTNKKMVEYKNLPEDNRVANDSTILVLQIASEEMCDYLKELKLKIVCLSEGITESKAQQLLENPSTLKTGESTSACDYLLFVNGKAAELETKLENFKDILIALDPNNTETKLLFSSGLSTKEGTNYGQPVTWKEFVFRSRTLIGCLTALTNLEIFVRQAEIAILKKISNGSITSNI